MNQRLAPALLFFPMAVIFLGAAFLFPSPLTPLWVFYTFLLGAVWNFLVSELGIPNPRLAEVFPLVMLLIFMGILTQILEKPTSAPMFHAVRGLLVFRTLVFILRVIQGDSKPFSRRMLFLIGLLVFEIAWVVVRVYHLIYQPVSSAETQSGVPVWLNWVDAQALALGVALLTLHAYVSKQKTA